MKYQVPIYDSEECVIWVWSSSTSSSTRAVSLVVDVIIDNCVFIIIE